MTLLNSHTIDLHTQVNAIIVSHLTNMKSESDSMIAKLLYV